MVAENAKLEEESSEARKRFSEALQQKEEKHTELERVLRSTVDSQSTEIEKLNKTISEQAIKLDSATKDLREKVELAESLSRSLQERPEIVEPAAGSTSNNHSSKDVVRDQVKQILNTVFRKFREEIEVEESYEGSSVLRITMTIIKDATLTLLKDSSGEESSEEEDSSSDSEPDDEDDDLVGLKNFLIFWVSSF